MSDDNIDAAVAWQVRVWDAIAGDYEREIDARFGPVIEYVLECANLQPGQQILDLGTGTGSVAVAAAAQRVRPIAGP